MGLLKTATVQLDDPTAQMKSLIVEGSKLDVIIGKYALEDLRGMENPPKRSSLVGCPIITSNLDPNGDIISVVDTRVV